MNFLKSFGFGGGLGGNLPYEIEKQDKSKVEQVLPCFDVLPGKSKTDKSLCVSIFQSKPNSVYPVVANALKRMRTLRHPNILEFKDGYDSGSSNSSNSASIIIVTEAVVPLELYLKQQVLSLEAIQWGIRSIVQALEFLSSECHLFHGNVQLCSIFVTKGGDWKLSGFELLDDFASGPSSHFRTHEHVVELLSHYKSPERLTRSWTAMTLSSLSTDIWSLGVVMAILFARANSPSFNTHASVDVQDPAFQRHIPSNFKTSFLKCFQDLPTKRITAPELLRHSFFTSSTFIRSMDFLDQLAIQSVDDKVTFYQQLFTQLDAFPKGCCVFKILPTLKTNVLDLSGSSGSVKVDASASCVVPIMLKIGQLFLADEEHEYKLYIIPSVLRLFSCNDRAVRVELLKAMDTIAPFLDAKVVNGPFFDHVCTGFIDTAPILRELTVKSMLPLIAKLNDHNLNVRLMKNFAKLQGDAEPAIRTNTTICLGKIATDLNDTTRRKAVLPAFFRTFKDPFPHARLAGLKSLSANQTLFESSAIAGSILPAIAPLLMDSSSFVREEAFAAVNQFVQSLVPVSKEMKVIEEEQQAKQAAEARAAEERAAEERRKNVQDIADKTLVTESTAGLPKSIFAAPTKSNLDLNLNLDLGSLNTDGWGDGLDDFDLNSPMEKQTPVKSSSSGMKLTSNTSVPDEDDDDPWEDEWGLRSKKVQTKSTKSLIIDQRKKDAKERREQRKQLKATTSVKVTKNDRAKKDEWDDWG